MPARRDALFLPGASRVGRSARALPRRRARQGRPAHRARAGHYRRARLRVLFSHRLGPGSLCPWRGHPLPGRGSAANSAVCYCLGVTAVDPDRIDVLFERFISKDRAEAPDIDIDFEHQRREEVLQYIYEKYGRDRAGMTAELITYRPRSAVRDVGKALGLSLDRVDALAKTVGYAHDGAELCVHFAEAGLDASSRLGRQLIHLVREILGFPRHLSQHVGGMVLTRLPLCEIVPIENAAMPGRTVVQWDKDDLDALGILKVDCLALGMLSAIRRSLDLLREQTGRSWALADVPAEDPAVYAMIQRRHGWRVSDRVARTDEHVAALEAGAVLRSGDRGGDRAARSDPGEDGPPLPAQTMRRRAGVLPQRGGARGP